MIGERKTGAMITGYDRHNVPDASYATYEWTLPRSSQSSRRRRFLAREMSENSTHRRTGGEDHRRYKLTRRCNFLDDLRIGSGQSRSEDTDIAAKKEAHPSPTRYQHIPTGLAPRPGLTPSTPRGAPFT
ncbi:hypothetical protein KGM_209049 [Danaus plexippus plexippus]|uniref:Uncharacterized protein n=1 Tax=Danaus plexippus plexippus TaxID=278856 RepID=A0A212FCQ9_DANPL|nr:hypothetical protein KGM_209049 [Danaus plexippus plexippus]